MKHDINKLPKWAQNLIRDMKIEIEGLQALKQMHAILSDKDLDWFTIPALTRDTNLWMLNNDKPNCVCSLSKNDMLFVGRVRHMHLHHDHELSKEVEA